MTRIWQGKQKHFVQVSLIKKKYGNCRNDHLTLLRPQKNHLGIISQPKGWPVKSGFDFKYMNDSGKNLRVTAVFHKDVMASVKASI